MNKYENKFEFHGGYSITTKELFSAVKLIEAFPFFPSLFSFDLYQVERCFSLVTREISLY